MRCRLIAAQNIGEPAKVEIIDFVGAEKDSIEVYMLIGKIKNPKIINAMLRTPDVNITVSVMNRVVNADPGQPSYNYLFHETCNLFMDVEKFATVDINAFVENSFNTS